MLGKKFWLSTAERAAKSAAQCLLGLWAGDGFDFIQIDWQHSLGLAGGAALLSILTSVVSAPVGPDGSPSLVGEPPVQPATVLTADPDDGTTAEFTPDDLADARGEVVHSGDNPVDRPGRHTLDDDPTDIPVSRFSTPSATKPPADR